jgi:hypothetical protein
VIRPTEGLGLWTGERGETRHDARAAVKGVGVPGREEESSGDLSIIACIGVYQVGLVIYFLSYIDGLSASI